MKNIVIGISVVFNFLTCLNYVTAAAVAQDYDESEREDPAYHVGRFVQQISKQNSGPQAKFVVIQYLNKACFGTVINFSSFYVATTCSCAAQMDSWPVPVNKLNSRFDREHTKIMPSDEQFYFEHLNDKDAPGDKLIKNHNKIVLVIRHPKCHIKDRLYHYNIAVVRVSEALHIDFSYIKAAFNQTIATAVLRMYVIAETVARSCYNYFVNETTLALTSCSVWHNWFELWPREPEKDVYEQGTMCLDRTSCDFTLGTPVCCGPRKNCYGIVTGNCWDCMNIHITYFNMVYRDDFHLKNIDDAWEMKLHEKGEVNDPYRQFWSFKPKKKGPGWPYGPDYVPDKSASASTASFSLFNLFKKALNIWA